MELAHTLLQPQSIMNRTDTWQGQRTREVLVEREDAHTPCGPWGDLHQKGSAPLSLSLFPRQPKPNHKHQAQK